MYTVVKRSPRTVGRIPLAVRTSRLAAPVVLVLGHLLALQLSLALAFLARHVLDPSAPARPLASLVSIGLPLLFLPLGYAVADLYPGYGISPVERLRREVQLTFLMFLALIGAEWLYFRAGWSRGVLIVAMGFAMILVPLMAALSRQLLDRFNLWGAPVLLVGAGTVGELLGGALVRDRTLGLIPVGFLDDDPEKRGEVIGGIPVIGTTQDPEVWARSGVRMAVLSMPGAGKQRIAELLEKLPFPKVYVVPDLLGLQSLWVSSRDLGGVLALEVNKNLLLRRNRFVKRAVDWILAVPLFLVSLPVMGLLALWIKLVSPGPAFYAQEREGYKGRPIRVWKLRTMCLDAEARLEEYLAANPAARQEWQRYFKIKNDPRVLPGVGRFLRRSSLDELPQLWSVLKGDMSLVGPRPFPSYHMERFPPTFRALRASVWPGLTGLWQVSTRSDGDVEAQQALDTYYIRNWSPWLDIYILARTVWVVLTGKGAH